MKIIFSRGDDTRAEHARELVLKELKDKPRGIAHHTALYPQVCDECAKTYWSKDQWGSHLQCKGTTRNKGLGFSA